MAREKPIAYVWALAALALLVGPPVNAAEERIHRFDANIEIRQDGVLLVTETIEVTALRKKIKRGIYRDIPVVSSPTFGMRKVHGFSVLRVARDGHSERYHLDSSGDLSRDVKRIYIGQANQQLDEGRDTYTLAYETSGWLLHHDLRDELYWNVTGNDWEFPIDQVSVRVVLPAGYSRDALEIGGWTGRKGSKARNWKLGNITSRHEIHLETTTPLARREGFTIGILWPADAVQRPSVQETRDALLRDNCPSVVALLGLLGEPLSHHARSGGLASLERRALRRALPATQDLRRCLYQYCFCSFSLW